MSFIASLKSLLPTREVTRAPTKEEITQVATDTIAGLKESIGLLGTIGGVVNQFTDAYGGIYFNTNQLGGAPFLGGMRDNKRFGRDRYLYWTDEQLNWFRNYCRWISKTVPFAIGLFRHMVNFTVKTGYKVEVESKEGYEVPEEKLKAMKARIIDFQKRFEKESGGVVHWASWEQMNKKIGHVDGERIWRLYPTPEGMMMRRIEPEQLRNPPNGTETDGWYGGVRCVKGDAFKRIGYWITNEPGTVEGELVDPDFIIHYKRNADDLTARGISDLLPVGDDMVQVDKLMESFRRGATERAKIVAMRVHKEHGATQIAAMASALKEVNLVNRVTGRPEMGEHTEPGTMIDCDDWTDVKTMPAGNTEEAIAALDACLRGLSQTWCMAEFIATSNAQNANYASTQEAGRPTTRFFETEQAEDCGQYKLLYCKVLDWDAKLGEFGFSEEDLEQAEIKVSGPSPVIVDEKAQAEMFEIEMNAKVRSKADWQRQKGLDTEVMREEIAEEEELYPEADPLGSTEGGGANGDDSADPDLDIPAMESYWTEAGDWDDSKHPRATDGKFGAGGGSPAAPTSSGTRTARNINDIAKKGYANVKDHILDFAKDLHTNADSMSANDIGNYLSGVKGELESMAKSAGVGMKHDGPLGVELDQPEGRKSANRKDHIRGYNQMNDDVKGHIRDFATDLVISARRKEPIDIEPYLSSIGQSMANAGVAAGVNFKGKHVVESVRHAGKRGGE